MAMIAMFWTLVTGDGVFRPLNLIADAVLGDETISGGFQMDAALAGMMIHLAMSALFGLVFAGIVANTGWDSNVILVAGIAYGLLLWLVNVVLIDENLVPNGLSEASTPLVIVTHAVYGMVVGLVVAARFSDIR